jgi:hypothetical protein
VLVPSSVNKLSPLKPEGPPDTIVGREIVVGILSYHFDY